LPLIINIEIIIYIFINIKGVNETTINIFTMFISYILDTNSFILVPGKKPNNKSQTIDCILKKLTVVIRPILFLNKKLLFIKTKLIKMLIKKITKNIIFI
jgi:hypothetical protein